MTSFKFFAIGAVACVSLPLMMAQQVNTQVQGSASGSAAGAHVSQSANAGASATAGGSGAEMSASGSGNASASAAMRPVTGELEGKLDAKTAKPGDRVFLKTQQKMKTADGTVIPKGSRLVGHVTEVQTHEKGHAESEMGIAFDRAELKGGQSMAIHSMIESVQPSAGAIASSSMANDDAFDAPMAGGGVVRGSAVGGGRAGGGGLLGGTAGGATQATGHVGSDLGSTAGGAVRTTGNLGGDATGSLARGASGVGGTVHGVGSLGARATGIPGVMLNGDATGSASGMLSSANKNVHLDTGTQMVLGIAASR